MGILVGLVLFTSSVALLLYLREGSENEQKNVAVYVAAKHLNKGEYIGADAIIRVKLPTSYIDFTPPVASEIIGKYAKSEIFAKEPIRPQKLSSIKPEEETTHENNTTNVGVTLNATESNTTTKNMPSDTIAIPLSVFKNRDSSLHAGSFVDIISVDPKKLKNREWSFSTKYIAVHVPVHHFVSKNVATSSFTRTVTTTKTVKKQKISTSEVIEADTVVLSMKPKDLKNFLAIYYKTQALDENRVYNTNNYGGQLWMVNAANTDEELQKEKEKMLLDKKRVVKKRKRRKPQPKVTIAYEK